MVGAPGRNAKVIETEYRTRTTVAKQGRGQLVSHSRYTKKMLKALRNFWIQAISKYMYEPESKKSIAVFIHKPVSHPK